jgi:cysteinyl-tRNA synthetase
MVQLGEEKMSKSLGNLITIKEALQKYSADAIRIFALSSHYHSPLTYSKEVIEAAEGGVERLLRVISRDDPTGGKGEVLDAKPYYNQFIEAMDDDFNTAQAIATLFDLAREINRADESGIDASKAREILKELGGVLGLTFKAAEEPALDVEQFKPIIKFGIAKSGKKKLEYEKVIDSPDAKVHIQFISELRDALRKDKKFQSADEIRAKLAELGISLEDTPQGTVWKRKR